MKVTLYMHDLNRRKELHQAWMEFFLKDPPELSAVGIADANALAGRGRRITRSDVIALAP